MQIFCRNRFVQQIILCFVVMFGLVGCLKKDANMRYQGIEFLKCPEGLIEQGGWVVDQKNNLCISHIIKKKDKTEMLWLEKAYMSGNNVKYYIVLDVITLPKIDRNQMLVGLGCSFNGKFDSALIAIVKYEDEIEVEDFTNIIKAWKVNIGSNSIEEIGVKGISCVNQSFGI